MISMRLLTWPAVMKKLKRAAVRIGDGVKLGVHAAFRTAESGARDPLFTARLDAVRCAFK
jgi:hypothetical protein